MGILLPRNTNTMTTPATMKKSITMTSVFKDNFEAESKRILDKLEKSEASPMIAFDTEFPGTIHGGYTPCATPEDSYKILKKNVDKTNIIQLGLTLKTKNSSGETCYDVWEFNFKDFNLSCRDHHHNPKSIKLLREHGIDFDKNAKDGIDSRRKERDPSRFATLLLNILPLVKTESITWIGFHSAYDLGYMIKILTGGPLPDKLSDFKSHVKGRFGAKVYDLKYVIKDFHQPGLYGGLDKIATALKVHRAAGMCHQAGSDSLLTMQTYDAVSDRLIYDDPTSVQSKYGCKLFGLEECQSTYSGSYDGKSGLGNHVQEGVDVY